MPSSSIAPGLLPNIRSLFIPDPGYVICDCDLSGADAQVVAWEADDEDLKEAFKKGLKIHHKNAEDMWGEKYTSLNSDDYRKKELYAAIKVSVHGTNYIGSAKTLATTLGWTIRDATEFQERWFRLHPNIKKWHSRIRDGLERSRAVWNKFGFRRIYFDRIDTILPEAVAWGPQSTVAITCNRGAINVEDKLPWVQILIQVHDSLVLQIPKRKIRDLLQLRDTLRNPVPYSDPLYIPWGLSLSPRSWGDCKETKWEEAIDLKF